MSPEITNDNKCQRCTQSICCNYVTQQIDTPRKKSEFSQMLWQVSHQKVEFYKDSDGWFILFNTACEHLETNGDCGIYETRPEICISYENDYCEYDSPADEGFDLHFKTYESLLAYCQKRFKRWP